MNRTHSNGRAGQTRRDDKPNGNSDAGSSKMRSA